MSKPCLLCQADTKRIQHKKLGVFHSCQQCEFIFKDEAYIVSEEDEVEVYDRHNNSIEDPRYVEFFYKFLNDAVFPYVGEGKQGFDFGSGPSPVLAQILERYHGYQMDIYDLFYAPETINEGRSYDLITTTEVAEHLQDPLKYFHLFKKLLKPEGILAVMTLFHCNDDDHFLNWHYIRDWTHISFYTSKTMEYIGSQVGLKVIHTDGKRFTTFVPAE